MVCMFHNDMLACQSVIRVLKMLNWKPFSINNQTRTISYEKTDDVRRIFVTDLVELWFEELNTEAIIERCKTLNPLLKIKALNMDEIMDEILTNIPNHAVEMSVNSITLHKNIQGGIFKFRIELSKGSEKDFFKVVTKSLCLSSIELFRRYSLLEELVKKKDEEIKEYKAVGAKLIRKHIETKRFTEELFGNEGKNGLSSVNAFQSVVGLCNAAQQLDSNQEAIYSKNLESPVKPGTSNAEAEKRNVPTSSETEAIPKRKKEEKRRMAKKTKKSAISASFMKPIVKKESRITNFIS